MRSVARPVSALAACLVAVALTGCAGEPGVATVAPGVPDGVMIDPLSGAPAAVWIERGASFAVVTMGSSSCPAVESGADADGDDRVVVVFGPSPHDPCTADMAPTTHAFDLPEGVGGDTVQVDIRFEDWPETYSVTLE